MNRLPISAIARHILCLLAAAFLALSAKAQTNPNFEYGVDRRGGDYRSFDLPFDAPGLCAGQCAQEGQCRAWTYVKPGVQGPAARCWLKNVVPAQSRDANTISGLRTATAPQPAPLPVPAAAGAGFMGCFKDTSVFDLDGHLERSAQNTPQRCSTACRARGFAYAAVQYGESCLCGNSYGRYGPASNCNYACTGDRGQFCGGYNANSVYTTGVAAAGPSPATPSAPLAPAAPAAPAMSAKTCWDWYGEYLDGRTFTGHSVTLQVDGNKVASTWGWTGMWGTDGQRNFWIYWSNRPDPNQVDMLKLSADGRTLEGRNFETRLIRGALRPCP